MPVLADLSTPLIALLIGVPVVVLFALIVGVETVVLLLLRWGSLGRSLNDALLMNLPTTLVGLILIFSVLNIRLILLSYTTRGFLYLFAWALSTVIEGGMLLLLNRHPARKVWHAALFANLASYLLQLLLIASFSDAI